MRRAHAFSLLGSLALGGCAVGPNYSGPPQDDFPLTPAKFKNGNATFVRARPADETPRGAWWRIFRDAELARLEDLALGANQDLRLASARIAEARAQTRVAAAAFFPMVQFEGTAVRERTSDRLPFNRGELLGNNPLSTLGGATAGGAAPGGGMTGGAAGGGAGAASSASTAPPILAQQPRTTTQNTFRAPLDLSWEIDLFGRVRRNVESQNASRQAIDADYVNMALTVTANVASNYFMLRALDAQIGVLQRTIESRKESLRIATERLNAGLTDELDVSRAKADLANNEADLASTRRSRGEMENAIATLIGQPASTLRLAYRPAPLQSAPPNVPAGIPSRMLERRPDVAEAERNLAAANAQIGVAVAAFFPQIQLTGQAGYESTDLGRLFQWPARFWQLGPSVTLPIFTGGQNLANLRVAQARYAQNVAQYRGKVLTAFQDVESALSDLRYLAEQMEAVERSISASRRALQLSQDKYINGAISYLDVLDAQRTLLQSELTSAQLVGQRLQTTVQFIKALGGDWR